MGIREIITSRPIIYIALIVGLWTYYVHTIVYSSDVSVDISDKKMLMADSIGNEVTLALEKPINIKGVGIMREVSGNDTFSATEARSLSKASFGETVFIRYLNMEKYKILVKKYRTIDRCPASFFAKNMDYLYIYTKSDQFSGRLKDHNWINGEFESQGDSLTPINYYKNGTRYQNIQIIGKVDFILVSKIKSKGKVFEEDHA